MKKMVNLTPHSITFVLEGGDNVVVEPSGVVARVTPTIIDVGVINGIPVTETKFGDVTGIPDPEDGTIYIVSSLVAQRVPERSDVFIPSESIRDDQGRIIGCRSLGRI